MALDINQLNATTKRFYLKQMIDNIFASNALMQRWKSNGVYSTQDGGSQIYVPVAYATTTAAGSYSGSQTLDTADNEQFTAAVFNWVYYWANITILRSDELKNSGISQAVDLLKSKIEIAEKSLKSVMGTDIFNTGTDTTKIVGLRAAVLASGTYGGIARASNSWWNATALTTTTLSIPALRGLCGDVTIDNSKPTVHITTQDQFDKFYGLLQPQQRFADEKANGGFTHIMFEGKPVIVDSHCPSGYWFALNEEYIKMQAHSDENFRFEPFQKPVNQNVSYAKIFWSGALIVNNPRMQGVFTSLT